MWASMKARILSSNFFVLSLGPRFIFSSSLLARDVRSLLRQSGNHRHGEDPQRFGDREARFAVSLARARSLVGKLVHELPAGRLQRQLDGRVAPARLAD